MEENTLVVQEGNRTSLRQLPIVSCHKWVQLSEIVLAEPINPIVQSKSVNISQAKPLQVQTVQYISRLIFKAETSGARHSVGSAVVCTETNTSPRNVSGCLAIMWLLLVSGSIRYFVVAKAPETASYYILQPPLESSFSGFNYESLSLLQFW
jgi:hypothetical protein